MLSTNNNELMEIKGSTELAINEYFQTINQENFQATAQLFIEDGTLIAPFESPISGREKIAEYLAAEAKGMKLIPYQGSQERVENELCLFKIKGKVKTPLFSVNVAWNFHLNTASQIVSVRVKLLASLQELLKIRR